jgi:predicted aspartyl protease
LRRVAILLGAALLLGTPASSEGPPPGAVVADVPFLPAGGPNRILIDLAPEAGQRRFPMMLDTGATYSVVSRSFAREMGVSVRPAKETPYRRATRLGRDLQFLVHLGSDSSTHPSGYGFVGGNFLGRYVLEIAFSERRVRFLDPQQYQVPERVDDPAETIVPLRVVSDRPFAEVEMHGRRIRVLVDTGDPFGLSLLRSSARELGVEGVPVEGLVVWGSRGRIQATVGEARQVRLGSLELEPLPILLYRSNDNQAGASGASLGYDVLSHFDVRIDMPRRRMWLRRNEGREATLFGGNYPQMRRTGAYLEPKDDAVLVRFVFPDTPAARLGLEPGDWISPLVMDDLQLDLRGLQRRIEQGRGTNGVSAPLSAPGTPR